jgi:hypothetical protein
MKKYLVSALLLLIVSVISLTCKKNNAPPDPVVLGTVIGFDQCTVNLSKNISAGYVIKIDSISAATGDTITIDTATTYNLPDIFEFANGIFDYYQFSYLFPDNYRSKYKFKFSYTIVPNDQKFESICKADIYLAPVIEATKGKQISITKNYGIIK